MRSLILLSLLAACLLPSVHSADWPEWRGPGRAGVWSGVKLPARLTPETVRRVWSASLGGGYSGIAVQGSRLYTLDRPKDEKRERVICLDAGTGSVLWKHEYDADYRDMDYDTGPRSTPTIDGGLVLTLGAVAHAFCLEAGTGKVIWALDAEKTLRARIPQWGHAASPLIAGDLAIFQLGARPGGTVVALEKRTGKERWRALEDAPGYSSPALIEVEGERQVAFWSAENVVGLAPATGEVLWRVPYKSTYDVAIISPVFEDGTLFVSGYWEGTKTFRLRRGAGPEPGWAGKMPSCLMSVPLHRDGRLYALDKDDGVICLEWGTGKVLWKDGHRVTPKARNPQASMVWAGDRAVILNELGELILARLVPDGYEEHGRVPIIGKTWAHPAYSGQEVYARSDTEIVRVSVLPDSGPR